MNEAFVEKPYHKGSTVQGYLDLLTLLVVAAISMKVRMRFMLV